MFDYAIKSHDKTVDVVLKGRLDATKAPTLMEEMQNLAGEKVDQIVFQMEDLEYIASAGLRVIIFTKQRIGPQANVIMKNMTPQVKAVMEITGLDNFVTFA